MTFRPERAAVPAGPGIYLMKDAGGQVIYVGKAKSLRSRVMSYFGRGVDYKTSRLVERVAGIEFVVTDSEGEAFALESSMIKRHRPRFNIELKDQERYTYLKLSDEEYPRLLVARRTRDGRFVGRGRTFGPFTQGSSKLLTVGSLRKAFKIRICRTLPDRVCLEYHLGNCEGPCEFAAAREGYAGHVSDLEDVLKGRDREGGFARRMLSEMRSASDSRDFERAMEIRDTLRRLDGLRADQKMDRADGSNEEYFGISVVDQRAVVMTFRKVNGVIRDSDRFSFDAIADNDFASFLYQYYTTRSIPGRILVSSAPAGREALEGALSERAGRGVEISVPRRGRRREMIDLIMRNVALVHSEGGDPALGDLQRRLALPAAPRTIECFDISNHGGSFAVGAMSRLVDGRPDKAGYRRFRIRSVGGRDDFAMMGEVVARRYRRILAEGGGLPDLVLVDGGKGQLSSAAGALAGVGARVPCAALAKGEELVFLPGRRGPVSIPRREGSLKVLQRARDEAHRFAVAYNRKVQSMGVKK